MRIDETNMSYSKLLLDSKLTPSLTCIPKFNETQGELSGAFDVFNADKDISKLNTLCLYIPFDKFAVFPNEGQCLQKGEQSASI